MPSDLHRSDTTTTHSSFLNSIQLDPRARQHVRPRERTLSTVSSSSSFSSSPVLQADKDVPLRCVERTDLATNLPVPDCHDGTPNGSEAESWSGDDDDHGILALIDPTAQGGTRPLRVRKKKGKAGDAGARAKRLGSAVSFVHAAPSRPPGLKRFPSTSGEGSSRAHATISRLFLSLPDLDTSPSDPFALQHSTPSCESFDRYQDHEDASSASSNVMARRQSSSSMHLGLGHFQAYDPIVSGPSPSTSPVPSPTQRVCVAIMSGSEAQSPASPCATPARRRPALPVSPVTPSRAPRKAAKLLGADAPQHMPGRTALSLGRKMVPAALSGKHFRPLPNSALEEIERFFGDLPRRSDPRSRPNNAKTAGTVQRSFAQTSADPTRIQTERNVGSGQAVEYRAEDGSMWLGVEEEQEFAWLMSDVVAVPPQPLPSLDSIIVHDFDGSKCTKSDRSLVATDARDASGSGPRGGSESDPARGDEDDPWDMKAFTSVLSLPRPSASTRTTPDPSKDKKDLKRTPFPFALRKDKSEDSFLDLGMDEASPSKKLVRPFKLPPSPDSGSETSAKASAEKRDKSTPWTSRVGGTSACSPGHARSLSSPIPSSPNGKPVISAPMPTLLPPPRISSMTHQRNGSSPPAPIARRHGYPTAGAGVGLAIRLGGHLNSGSDGESTCSQSTDAKPRTTTRTSPKRRPPPLTIAPAKPNGRLPVLTPSSPSVGDASAGAGTKMSRSQTSPPASGLSTCDQPASRAQPAHTLSAQHKLYPATLSRGVPSASISTQRSKRQAVQSKCTSTTLSPETPFVRPRTAPRPALIPMPATVPPFPLDIPVVAPIPASDTAYEPQSFFEPVTPTSPVQKFSGASNRRGVSAGGDMPRSSAALREELGQAQSGGTKGWLKRVVRPLGGRV
ncbi:hypothetical protein IAU60_003869 [Kwoniella sp. DSM 27419]